MHHTQRNGHARPTKSPLPSKDMAPLPSNMFPIFIRNQFRTTIDLPTKEKYPNIPSQCAIVTGSNTGLGLESSRQLLSLGLSHLIMAVRSIAKANAVANTLRAAHPSAKIDVWELDMESYDSIQAFVRKCQSLTRIDIVILNAGLGPMDFTLIPATGHEKTIQVNYLSTMLLSVLLLPILKSKRNPQSHTTPRLTVINSVTAHLCKFPNRSLRPLLPSFDSTSLTPWDPSERYGVSKLLGQLFIVKLAEYVNPDDVIINMVDPGLTKGTSLSRDTRGAMALGAKLFFGIAGRTVDRGAATYIDAAAGQGRGSHGCFLMNCRVTPLASIYYTDGKVLTDVLWKETLAELAFADAEGILARMRSTEV